MKTIHELLSEAQSLNVQLWAEGDRLRYSAPKGVMTDTLRRELQERKIEIVKCLHKSDSGTALTIEPVSRDSQLLLSFSQQSLWFLDQLESNRSLYNIPTAFRLSGNLNLQVLQQALDAIVAYHEVLRTTYKTGNGSPVQVINNPQPVALQVIDLQSYDEAEQQSQVQQRLQQESQRPFNLASDLMLRGCVLQLSTRECIVLLVMHHIASDGWSMRILREQLTQLYQAFLEGKPNPLEKLPIQYADYALWQRQWLSGENLDKQLNYWKQQLAGANPVLELPSDRPRPAVQTFRGASQSFIISPTLAQSLKALCHQERATLYMTLLAAFQTLLSRYSGQEDIIVGSPIAGRNRSELESLIGFFVNTLVLRTDLSGNPSFRDLLKRVRQVALGAYEHQALPFEKLVEELQPERSLSYNPLFQVMFALQNAPQAKGQLLGLKKAPVELESGTAKFDLTLSMVESADGLRGEFEYSTDLFDAATIERMVGHFQTLLEGIVANPNQPIATLPLLTETERHQLLVEWNKTQMDYPQGKCIHQLFEEQVERTPDAIAVVFQDQKLTYRELNGRANQLAHYLQTLGVGPEVLVGICVERSLEMVIGLLGILKAGGAYVPLDPAYPKDRLNYIIENAQLSLLLTQQAFCNQFSKQLVRLVNIDIDWVTISRCSSHNLNSEAVAKNLAYVIYTSGSTGKPKGVMIEHHSLTYFAQTIIRSFNLDKHDRVMQFSSVSFDISVEEIFPTLVRGASLILRSEDCLSSIAYFLKFVEDYSVSVLDLPTAFWHTWMGQLSYLEQPIPDCVRLVIVGGEAVSSAAYDQWKKHIGSRCRWLNTYGPTETTVTATLYDPENGLESRYRFFGVPIGRAMANAEVYVLDEKLQTVPIGVPGELFIGGAGIARGYLNNPELTEQRFITHAFEREVGVRLYKTGDIVRYQVDGVLEYLSRIDHQVKIRGFRIELGEIETALSQHPAVQQCVVVAREDEPGDKRLVAYLVMTSSAGVTVSELRQFLKRSLPDYMIPSAFVELEQFPLTPNGKVDRRALPKPEGRDLGMADYVAPRTPLEQQLAEIWIEVLKLERVGIHDNFFELGGHSLLAIELLAEIETRTGLRLPLNQLLSTPTIEAIVRQLSGYKSHSLPSCIVPLKSGQDNPPFFLIHGGGAGLLFYQDLIKNLKTKRAVYGIKSLFLDDLNAPISSVEEMAAHYLEQMRAIQPQGPYLIGGFCFGGYVAYEIAQELRRQGEEIGALILIEKFAPGGLILPPWYQRYQRYWQSFLKSGSSYLINKIKSRLIFELSRLQHLMQHKKESFLYKKSILPIDDQESYAEFQAREIFRLHSVLNSKYCLKTYSGSIFLLTASDAVYQNITGENLGCGDLLTRREDLGWSQYILGDLEILPNPGDHDSMLQVPHVQVLAEQLDSILED